MTPQAILHFWFTELTPAQHFAKDAALDDTIGNRFGAVLEAAARCELFGWRDTPRAFAQDALAQAFLQQPGSSF